MSSKVLGEKCVGCGNSALKHPWVAVMRSDGSNVLEKWVAKPCCDACHVDPAHRKVKLKAHFFDRAGEKQGLALAGSTNIGMGG